MKNLFNIEAANVRYKTVSVMACSNLDLTLQASFLQTLINVMKERVMHCSLELGTSIIHKNPDIVDQATIRELSDTFNPHSFALMCNFISVKQNIIDNMGNAEIAISMDFRLCSQFIKAIRAFYRKSGAAQLVSGPEQLEQLDIFFDQMIDYVMIYTYPNEDDKNLCQQD